MKILLAADGSKYTKKALAFLATDEGLLGPDDKLVVLNVQMQMPPRVKSMLGTAAIADYHRDEAEKVLKPIERFLARQKAAFSTQWVAGTPTQEILRVATSTKAQLVVMGTHGHSLLGRALMGSVAQRVLAECSVPVLLVK